jgi:7-carboxy-7-deazaguanine synthase
MTLKLARLGEGAEIFHTLQGEGISVGCPAIFVRLSLCNLHCFWCDTDHTWNFEGTPWKHEKDANPGYVKHRKEDVIIEMPCTEVAVLVRQYPCRRIVITGGEPLLQEKEIRELVALLRSDGEIWTFEIETNGTKLPSPEFLNSIDQLNVSPKLSHSGMKEDLRIKPDAIRGLVASGKAFFKFVVSQESDIREIQDFTETMGISPDRVILMPQARSVVELDRISAWLAFLCRDHGYRFSDRLHVRLWGDKRGV